MHFIARELAKIGTTRFFSSSFSLLSSLTGDHRLSLRSRANSVENFHGVDCYLWKTLLHPTKVPKKLDAAMDNYFRAYASSIPLEIRKWIADSKVILLESGGPEIFFDVIKTINQNAKVLYISSDDLSTIGSAAYVRKQLTRIASMFDGVSLPSRHLAATFPSNCKLNFVPHGLDALERSAIGESPYGCGINLVSVGNMLFDKTFFESAVKVRSDITFHVIGGGKSASGLKSPNIKLYAEMPFAETLRYLSYADAGLAPYISDRVPPYLADTSMKLMQYAYFGLPAICPESLVASNPGRFGYNPQSLCTISDAIQRALESGRFVSQSFMTWSAVVERILDPEKFPDTRIQSLMT